MSPPFEEGLLFKMRNRTGLKNVWAGLNDKSAGSTLLRILLFFIIAFPCLLFIAGSSSPLYPHIRYDDAIFNLMGAGWSRGILPYRDLFDNKGPLVYLIQMAGHVLAPGKWGVWLLEVMACAFSLELLYRTGRQFRTSASDVWLSLAIIFPTYVLCVDWGNTVEEWSLPFQVIALLYATRCLCNPLENNTAASFVGGLCFGATALIRINNNCIIVGLALGILIGLLRRREWESAVRAVLCFIGGALLVLLPFIVWFGALGILPDFFYDCFIYNWHYKFNWHHSGLLSEKMLYLMPCLLLPIVSFFYDRKNNTRFLPTFLLLSAITYLTFISGAGYRHYFLMVVPVAALSMLLACDFGSMAKAGVALYLMVLPIGFIDTFLAMLSQARHAAETPHSVYFTSVANRIKEIIPEADFDSVYLYDTEEGLTAACEIGIVPTGKYFYYQPEVLTVDPTLAEKMGSEFKKAAPGWIISGADLNEISLKGVNLSSYRLIEELVISPNGHNLYIYRRD